MADTYADPEDLQLLLAELEEPRAIQLIQLASVVVSAWVSSNLGQTIDPDAVPDPVKIATLLISHRLSSVGTTGDVVSASIDDASYRYQRPATIAEALLIDDDVGDLLSGAWPDTDSTGLSTIRTMAGT